MIQSGADGKGLRAGLDRASANGSADNNADRGVVVVVLILGFSVSLDYDYDDDDEDEQFRVFQIRS